MSSLEHYVVHVKPALDAFLSNPTRAKLQEMENEFREFNWVQLKIYHAQILVPMVVKLDELSCGNQELRCAVINCLRYVLSKLYLDKVKGLRSILVVILKQIRECNSAAMRRDLSEEIKLAAVQCITEALRRTTGEVLELFYTKDSAMVLGQVLLTLIELITVEKYKLLIVSSIECLMTVFYVHDEADPTDVVLRKQVADTIFIFLPKVITMLFKTTRAPDTLGSTIKSLSIQALGRIICLMFEETTDEFIKRQYNLNSFQNLFDAALDVNMTDLSELDGDNIYGHKKGNWAEIEIRLKKMQLELRSHQWIQSTSRKLRPIFVEAFALRSHDDVKIRKEHAKMCCLLLAKCSHNLKYNFIYILENVLSMSEDSEPAIAELCSKSLQDFQQRQTCQSIFDENAEQLLDAHLVKLPRILHRCDDIEQYAELLFLKAFLRNWNRDKLLLLLGVPKNLELFVACLLAALKLRCTRELLNEEYALREISNSTDYTILKDLLPWRQFKHLSTRRSVQVLYDICAMLGSMPMVNRIIFDYCLEMLAQLHEAMNEIILLLALTSTTKPISIEERHNRMTLVELLMEELLDDKHWHLALQPDHEYRLEADKPTSWFVDRTPGLYESAIEVRMQDCDSDDEQHEENAMIQRRRINIADAEFNVLHTCIVLDALGHCAQFIGETYDIYIFRSLHKVLLKLASSNTCIYQAAKYAFVSMQRALKFAEATHFIENSTDYISYHLNSLLKQTKQGNAAVDILSVVLQYSTRANLPHLEHIFQTMTDEGTKSYQSENMHSYLRVINAFLQHIAKWQLQLNEQVDAQLSNQPMAVDEKMQTSQQILDNWLNSLNEPRTFRDTHILKSDQQDDQPQEQPTNDSADDNMPDDNNIKPTIPRHIEMAKTYLTLVVKFISNASQTHQILAIECLISGVPVLRHYENELLPLAHLIWQPLMEKFRQKDAIVLNRCFTLLNLLALHVKDFILKRTLNDVMPFLKQFLRDAAAHSAVEHAKAQTQEYKLQLKLLTDFAGLIANLEIDGKHLNEISETIALYLADCQPLEFQQLAVLYFKQLFAYNGPFIYIIVLKRAYLKEYKVNVEKILTELALK